MPKYLGVFACTHVCRVCTCLHVGCTLCGDKRFKVKVFLDHFPCCSVKQKLSLNPELTNTAKS